MADFLILSTVFNFFAYKLYYITIIITNKYIVGVIDIIS